MKSSTRPIRRRLPSNPLSHEAHVAFGFPALFRLEPATKSRTAHDTGLFFFLLLFCLKCRLQRLSKVLHARADSEGNTRPRTGLEDKSGGGGRLTNTHPQAISFFLFCAALDTSSSCLCRTKSRQSAAWAMFTASCLNEGAQRERTIRGWKSVLANPLHQWPDETTTADGLKRLST